MAIVRSFKSSATPLTRGQATVLAYTKLGVLPGGLIAFVRQAKLAELFDAAYAGFAERHPDIEGEMYIAFNLSEQFGPFELYQTFNKVYRAKSWDWNWHGKWQHTLADWQFRPAKSQFYVNPNRLTPADFEVRVMLTGEDGYGNKEPGLYDIDFGQYHIAAQKRSDFDQANPGLALDNLKPDGYVAVSAIKLELGERPLDEHGTTSFIFYNTDSVAIPVAGWFVGSLGGCGSWGHELEGCSFDAPSGVRFSVVEVAQT